MRAVGEAYLAVLGSGGGAHLGLPFKFADLGSPALAPRSPSDHTPCDKIDTHRFPPQSHPASTAEMSGAGTTSQSRRAKKRARARAAKKEQRAKHPPPAPLRPLPPTHSPRLQLPSLLPPATQPSESPPSTFPSTFPPPAPEVCKICGAVRMGLENHMDSIHVEKITVEIWSGEWLTVSRREGDFHCPWCVDKTKPGRSRVRMQSAKGMEVSPSPHRLSYPAELPIQNHLRSCETRRSNLAAAQGILAGDPRIHQPMPPTTTNPSDASSRGPAGPHTVPALEPRREISFSAQVTAYPNSEGQPPETQWLSASPLITSLMREAESFGKEP